jgi:hypothetical protein
MRRETIRAAVVAGVFVAGGLIALAQTPPAPQPQPTASGPAAQTPPAPDAVPGGKLHGIVKSGNIPLPGVTVTAQNTLTGKRFQTTSDITGAWSLNLAQNGRFVLRTQFAAFAPGVEEAVLNARSHDQTVNFDLLLASRAAQQAQRQDQNAQDAQASPAAQAIRQLAANGAQNLSPIGAQGDESEGHAGSSGLPNAPGAELPSIAGNSDFGGDSVAISGQAGAVSPLAGLDTDRIRDAIETYRAQNGGQRGNFSGGGGLGGEGGGFGGGFGGGGGGRGNFRGFNPGQPHGAIFWIGSNAALNAEPFSLRGQSQDQPASGTNRFGLTFMSAPYLPGLTKPSGKDTVFLTLSGTRSSNPLDDYATVPTDGNPTYGTADERTGDFTGQTTIYDPVNDTACVNFHAPGQPSPTPGQPFPGNMIPGGCIATPASKLLLGNKPGNLAQFFPAPNLPGYSQNYHLLTTAQSNTTQVGVRYMRSLGANATQPGGSRGGFGGGGGGRRSQQNQGLRQSINFNYNWSDSASDNVNIFPQLGGKSASHSNSLQAGYTVGYHKITNIFNANWNRSASQTTNIFTNKADVAGGVNGAGIAGTDSAPIDFGLPNVVLGDIQGLNEQQPSFSLSQTISFSETLSWIHAKHNLRFGGDYRRVHRDFLGGSNSTGTFTFSGVFTGSPLADFLLGLPQETTIDATAGKSYLRDNVMDVYAQDDWRVRPNLTLSYGLRYEFYAPYTEKYGHLAFVDTNPTTNASYPNQFAVIDEVQSGGMGTFSGNLPDSLVFPYRTAFAPRFGFALRLPKQTVLRGGYGINYTVGQYATFASTMARQPMVNQLASQPAFVNEQTNEAANAGDITLSKGFGAPETIGNYALDPHYHLPYVQAWNLDVQKTLPWGVVLNAGYNGSKGSDLDITSAPRPTSTSHIFNYEQSGAFSRFNAGTLRVNKRLSNGIALGANYQYSHSIDDAGSVGGTSTVVAQNWQDLAAEEGNSSFDVRHKVTGTYLYELPFGKDKFWVTSGVGSHILEGFSISGSFTFATGTPLTPSYQAASQDVARGTAGSLRPDRAQGVSLTAGAGSQKEWFNTAAFVKPAGAFGTASRNSITGPGTIQNNMSLAKTMQLGDTRSLEFRATANNVFNTVQYSGVDTNVASPTFGQVISAGSMRAFQFTARFRF